MKPGKLWILVLIAGIAIMAVFIPRWLKPTGVSKETVTTLPANSDLTAIRSFTANPNMEVTFINTDLPTPYFRVGKVTKVGGGENMDPIGGWIRKVNVYDSKDLIEGKCSVYEYQTDARNNALVAVVIKGLKQSDGITCIPEPVSIPKLSKSEAEITAMRYLVRAIPNFDKIKDNFKYSTQQNGESHEWLWEDKEFILPVGIDSRPYPGPIIRLAVYGNNEIQYWNTTSLFEN